MNNYFKSVIRSVMSIGDGLTITFSHLFRKPITVQYPDRIKVPVTEMVAERFRGLLEVDVSLCTGCLACMRACPIKCLSLAVEIDPQTKERKLQKFDIDMSRCMLCGLCTEACPTNTLVHSKEFEADGAGIADLVFQFVQPGHKVNVYKPKKEGAPIRKPKGTVLKAIMQNKVLLGKQKGFTDENSLSAIKERLSTQSIEELVLAILGDNDFSHFGYTNNKELAQALIEGKESLGLLYNYGLGGKYLLSALKLVLKKDGAQ